MNKQQSNQKALLMLDVDKIVWYHDGLTNTLAMPFPADSVRHLEIIKRDEIIASIKNFITQNKIPVSTVHMVLTSRTLFIQDFQKDADEKNNVAAQDLFLGMVPFEEVVFTTIQGTKAYKIIAANQELIELIKETLKASGFSVNFVSPLPVLGDQYANLTSLDIPSAKAILTGSDILRKHTLSPIKKIIEEIHQVTPSTSPVLTKPDEKPKPSNTRAYIMLGVLGILLVILGVVVYFNVFAPPPTPKPPVKAAVNTSSAIRVSPTQIPSTDSTASGSAKVDPTILTVQILYSGTASSITPLRNDLEDIGFETIITRSAGSQTVDNTEVVLSGNVPVTLRDSLVQLLEEQYESVTVRSVANPQYDITITTGELKTTSE